MTSSEKKSLSPLDSYNSSWAKNWSDLIMEQMKDVPHGAIWRLQFIAEDGYEAYGPEFRSIHGSCLNVMIREFCNVGKWRKPRQITQITVEFVQMEWDTWAFVKREN